MTKLFAQIFLKGGLVCLSLIQLSGCIHPFNGPRNPASEGSPSSEYDETYESKFKPKSTELTFAELKSILEKNSFSRIEDLLSYLKDNKPDSLGRYALAYNSKSLHGSSKTNPRAIVYGPSANFVMTFNGSPDQKAYEMLEVMSFNNGLNTYEFFEIEFNEKQIADQLPYRISESGGTQGKCMACHLGGKPIWDTYPMWPGFYGSQDDFPLFLRDRENTLSAKIPGAQQRMIDEWATFKKENLTKGRYRFLQPLKDSLVEGGKNEPRPNTDLGMALFINNMKRITQLLKNAIPTDPRHRSLLLYGAFCNKTNQWIDGADELRKMAANFSQRANAQLEERNIYILKTELAGNSVPWTELQRALQDKHTKKPQYYPDVSTQNEAEFYKKAVQDNVRTLPWRTTSLPLFLSIVEKVAPKARMETWPMNIFKAYRFDPGYPVGGPFEEALLEALYPNQNFGADKEKIEIIRDKWNRLYDFTCADLLRAAGYQSNFQGYK